MSGRIKHKSSRMTYTGDWPYISLSTCLVGRCPCLHYIARSFSSGCSERCGKPVVDVQQPFMGCCESVDAS